MSDMLFLPRQTLEGVLTAVDLLRACFPLEDELEVPDGLVDRLALAAGDTTDCHAIKEDRLALRLRVEIDQEQDLHATVEIAFPLRLGPAVDISVIDADAPLLPTLTLLQPGWLQNAAFQRLVDQLADDGSSDQEGEPTAVVLDYVQRLQQAARTFLRPFSVASTRSSFDGSIDSLIFTTDPLSLQPPPDMTKEILLCVSKMHHIRSMSKFKKVKAFALEHGASGLAKTGRPGILLYEVEGKEALARFLESIRGLRYLEFHHLAAFAPSPAAATKTPVVRLNDGAPGLQEVEDTKDLILAAEKVGHKEWLRSALGMTGKGG